MTFSTSSAIYLVFLASILCTGCSVTSKGASKPNLVRSGEETQVLSLGFERPHTKVVVRSWFMTSPNASIMTGSTPTWSVEIETQAGAQRIASPTDLTGFVAINTENDALRYVRLWTTPPVHEVWATSLSGTYEYEIMSVSASKHMPQYGGLENGGDGISTHRAIKVLGTIAQINGLEAGTDGILQDSQFGQLGFKAPDVKLDANRDFQVTRWLFINVNRDQSETGELQLVRETVKPNGDYHRVVLKQISCEALSHPETVNPPQWFNLRFFGA